MLDHVALQVADVDASVQFYVSVFRPIGLREIMRYPAGESWAVGLGGRDGKPDLWLGPASESQTRELHVALVAEDRAGVDAVYSAALVAGAAILHAPRVWPEYHPGYYGVFLRDLDGNNVEAVHHTF